MPITLTIMSLYLYICSFNINNIHYCGIFFSGILLGLAIGTKINYLIISVCLIISIPISFIYNNIQIKSKIFFKSILIFCSGLLLSLLPLLLFFIKDPKVFIFNNFEYHFINTEWRILSGYPKAMSFYSKLIFSKDILLLIENKIAYSAILIGILFKYYNKHYFVNKNYRFSEYKYIFIIFFIVSFTSIFIHTPLFNQYFSLPLLFLYLTIIGIFSDLENNNIYLKFCNFKIELKSLLLFILVVIVFSYSISNILYSTHKLLYRKNWVGLHFHDVSQRIRSILTENQIDFRHKVASLSPLFAIESDMPVYLEFSTGPFLYRIGDLVDNNHHDLFIATSPTYLNELFDSSPPSAIIIGFEGDLDIPFANYAIRNNYMEILIDGFDGVLYIKPD